MLNLIPPRLCAYCHEPFTPTRAAQRYCHKPAACAAKGVGLAQRGRRPEAAIAAKQQHATSRHRAACHARFGDLSDRECRLYRYAYGLGYAKGYATVERQRPTRRHAPL